MRARQHGAAAPAGRGGADPGDTQVRTSRTGLWRLTVLHERRTVAKVRVRATRAARGFEHRVVVPDWDGADAVSVRVSPGGETCTATATVPES